jgi:hypothetical protein
MNDRIFGDREKAMEESYFHQEEARLLEKLRQNAQLDEIAQALAAQLKVDNPALLIRVRDLGITVETAPALFLAPLVQVAWAGGSVTKEERETVLHLARERGVETGSKAYDLLKEWLDVAPTDALFDAAIEVLKYGFAGLSPAERAQRIERVVDACHKVAEASGSELARLLGLGDGVSRSEAYLLDTIQNKLRLHT